MRILVTVGSTQFPELCTVVTSPQFLTRCSAAGVKSIVLQVGTDSEDYVKRTRCVAHRSGAKIEVVQFSYAVSLANEIAAADLIIGHCGAGTILDAVAARKPLIAVVNERLMGNHQIELRDAITQCGVVAAAATTDSLCNALVEVWGRKESTYATLTEKISLATIVSATFLGGQRISMS